MQREIGSSTNCREQGIPEAFQTIFAPPGRQNSLLGVQRLRLPSLLQLSRILALPILPALELAPSIDSAPCLPVSTNKISEALVTQHSAHQF